MANGAPDTVPDKLQPHNVEAEEALLGSLLIDPDAILQVSTFLDPTDFYVERHGWVYEAVRDLHERREPADLVTLTDELERRGQLRDIGGPAYLSSLINATPTSIHVEFYARIVERTGILRRLIDAAGEIARLAYQDTHDAEEVIDRAEEIIFNVSARRTDRDLRPIRQILDKFYDRIEYLHQHQGEIIGIPTGLADLDKLLGGLQRSDMIVMAGRPGMGKTSLALSIALQSARRWQKRVAVFSLEMSDEQLVQRLVSAETGIDSQRLRLGAIQDDEWPTFIQATNLLGNAPIFIDDTPAISALELRSKARRLHAEHGLDLLIVDYLQLMRGDFRSENRQQEISFISRSIKGLARELNIPILALSQLSRQVESRHDKRPMLSDLRESGCLTGDTQIYLPQTGRYVSIQELVGKSDFQVMGINTKTWKLETAVVTNAFATGVKPVYRLTTQLGRTIRATANHKFLTIQGWKRLDELELEDQIAQPRSLNSLSMATMSNAYCGTALYKQNVSRERAARLANVVESNEIARLSQSDVYWDKIASIEFDGEENVFDLTVPGLHNFVAGDIIVHNSIEQDADVVLFIYRDEIYNPDTEFPNIAEIIVSKHRSGPTGVFSVYFKKQLAQFVDLEVRTQPLEYE